MSSLPKRLARRTWGPLLAASLVAAGGGVGPGCGGGEGGPGAPGEAASSISGRTSYDGARPPAGTGTPSPLGAHLPPAMGAITVRPDATAAPAIEPPPPAPRPPDCSDTAPGGRTTTCCSAPLRALVTPSEARAACPDSGAYRYEDVVDGRSCLYFFARSDVIVSVIPVAELAAIRAGIERRPGFSARPELAAKLVAAGAPAPVEAFRMRRGSDLAPLELRTFVRAGERALVLALRPRLCKPVAMEALIDAVALRFGAGAGGAPRGALARSDLPGLVRGGRAPDVAFPGILPGGGTGTVGPPATPPTLPHSRPSAP